MKSIQIQAKVWNNPLFGHKRLVCVHERVGSGPVEVVIRPDLFEQLCGIFETSVPDERYLTGARIVRLKQSLAQMFSIEYFEQTIYFELTDGNRASRYGTSRVRRLTQDDLPAIQRALAREGITRNPADLPGFNGGYGCFLDNDLASWANIADEAENRSHVINVYTVRAERGRGYATAAVAACAREILSRGRIPRTSTVVENLAMNAICRKLGFEKTTETFEAFEQEKDGSFHHGGNKR
ncbi:MAG: GNAT family N-acetyltransferase [Planctomycetes bacterium]|nr:GNAT family N-acetyltransferase [Planctomycetota bacterium]